MVNPKGSKLIHSNCNCVERKEGRCQPKGLFIVKGQRHNCFQFKTEAEAKTFIGVPAPEQVEADAP